MTDRKKLLRDIEGLKEAIDLGFREMNRTGASATDRRSYAESIKRHRTDLAELTTRLQALPDDQP